MNEDQLYDAAEREMDLYRAEITRITAERDRLAAAVDALTKVAAAHGRVMFAAGIDIRRGEPGAARRLLGEHLGVWDGLPWDGTETGAQYLEHGRDGMPS